MCIRDSPPVNQRGYEPKPQSSAWIRLRRLSYWNMSKITLIACGFRFYFLGMINQDKNVTQRKECNLYYWFSRNGTNNSRVPHILQDKSRFISMHGSRSYYGKFRASHVKFRPNHASRINPLLPSWLSQKISDNLSLMIQNPTSIVMRYNDLKYYKPGPDPA